MGLPRVIQDRVFRVGGKEKDDEHDEEDVHGQDGQCSEETSTPGRRERLGEVGLHLGLGLGVEIGLVSVVRSGDSGV